MYKSGHTKSKSDSDFFFNKTILDEISENLYRYKNIQSISIKQNKIKKDKLVKKNTNSWQIRKNTFIEILEKILLLKKDLDYFFFIKKAPLIKLDLDNVLMIIYNKIEELENKLIKECPILVNSILIEKLTEFNEIILSLIETKPQEFYKQVKLFILSRFEHIRLEIFELLENLSDNSIKDKGEVPKEEIQKIKKTVSYNHSIIFNEPNIDVNNYNENDIKTHLTSELQENIKSIVLSHKKFILQFIEDITHELLFSMTRFSYIMDYYALCISELNIGLFKNISFYFDRNKNVLKEKEMKIMFLIELILVLNTSFAKKPIHNFQNIHNCLGNFILNNLTELIPKSKFFNLKLFENSPKKILESGSKIYMENKKNNSLFIKFKRSNIFQEFLPKFHERMNKFRLIKVFRLYFNLKLIFWKSIYTKIEISKQDSSICCRICEQNIPLNDFVLHVFYCKEQSKYYKSMNKQKIKFRTYIKSLEIYRTKINNEIRENQNNFIKKNVELNKIIKLIKKSDSLHHLDENNNDDFLLILIKLLTKVYEKPNDYYEINPQKLSKIFSLINLTYFVYAFNKTKLYDNDSEDDELSVILGNIISSLIKIFQITEYILEARIAKTKSNRYLKNINMNFRNSLNLKENESSSKNIKFLEIKSRNIINERRGSVRESNFSHQMDIFKKEFSYNKKYGNNNSSNNYSSVNGDSSVSNIEKSKEIHFDDLRSNSTKINENFLERKRLSNNFNSFMISKNKVVDFSNKSVLKDKNKLIKYIRNQLNALKHQKTFLINIKKSKSSKLINNNHLDKTIFKSEIHINNLLKKEPSEAEDDNNSFTKLFFSSEKKSNQESQLDCLINSEKDIHENENKYNNEKYYFFSSRTNNSQKKFQTKKELSSFAKPEVNIFEFSTLKNSRKKSLFKVFSSEIFNNKNGFLNENIQKKKIKENEKMHKKRIGSDKYLKKRKDSIINKYFEKVEPKMKNRASSQDFTKEKGSRKLLDGAKNLVLIESSESEKNSSSINSGSESNKINHKLLKFNSSSSISGNSSENPDSKISENENCSIDKSGTKNDDYRKMFDDEDEHEHEHALLSFDENFFINSEMSSRNKNLINIIKNNLLELNEEVKNAKEEEENNNNNKTSIFKTLKSTDSGSKFSNFKLILPVAKGGYGNVGLYKKVSTGDLYIIKSVDINKMKEQKLSKTLKNEKNIMKEISSDYVVTCYYLFKDKVNCYFVMEYLPGGDVYNLLSSIILPFSTIQLIVAETLLAVKYLHSKNIIHHDIKLENILITKNGHFKLSDFGLSKTINEKKIIKITDEENSSLGNSKGSSSSLMDSEREHNDNKVNGTLFYMAPELFTGDFAIGKSIDYWAIGIIIYELFTFKVPFEAETQEETKSNIMNYNINWDPIYSDEVTKHYKDNVDSAIDLIKKFIFFNPNQRWGDDDFDKIKNHEFFKNFDWTNIKSIKNPAVLSYLKKFVEKNNKKISEFCKGNSEKTEIICEENLAYDEDNQEVSQRLDNLQKRNIELIKMKYKKKDFKIEDHDKNFKLSLFFDLQ